MAANGPTPCVSLYHREPKFNHDWEWSDRDERMNALTCRGVKDTFCICYTFYHRHKFKSQHICIVQKTVQHFSSYGEVFKQNVGGWNLLLETIPTSEFTGMWGKSRNGDHAYIRISLNAKEIWQWTLCPHQNFPECGANLAIETMPTLEFS